MANKNIRGITIEIGGDTTKLGKALEDSEKKSRSLQTELREIERALKFDPTNVELLSQKQTVLTQNITETTKKLDTLKEAERQVIEQFRRGEVAEEQVRALQREILNTERSLNDMNSELNSTTTLMTDLANGTDSAERHTQEYADSLAEANQELEEFKGKASDAFDTIKTGALALGGATIATAGYAVTLTDEFDKAFNTLQAQTGASAEEMATLEESMTNIYRNNFGESMEDVAQSMSTVKTQTNLAGKELETTTQNALLMRDVFGFEVDESIRGVNSLMNQFGITADEAYALIAQGAQNGLNQNGDLMDVVNEYANQFASAGYSAEDMFNMLKNGAETGTWSVDKLGDTLKEFNIRASDGTVTDALLENARAFGLSKIEATHLSKEIESGSVGAYDKLIDKLKEVDDDSKRYQLGVAMFGTTWEDLGEEAVYALFNTQGEISKTSDALENINDIKYDDLGSAIGGLKRTLETDVIKPLGEDLKPLVEDVIGFIQENAPAITELLSGIASAIGDFVTWIVDNKETVLATITAIGAGFIAWNVVTTIQGVVSAIKAFTLANQGATIAQTALNMVMNANPIGIVITAITALVAGFIVLWNTSDEFREFWLNLWEVVKKAVGTAVEAIVKFFTTAWDKIKEVWKVVSEWFKTTLIQPLTKAFSTFWTSISKSASNAWSSIKNVWNAVSKWFNNNIIKPISGFFSTMWSKLKNGASDAWTGIKKVFSNIPNWFRDKFSDAWTKVKNVFSSGGKIFTGIKDGIVSAFKSIVNGIIKGINKVIATPFNAINKVLDKIRGAKIAGFQPFKGLGSVSVPQIPLLYQGGILKKGQVGLLEGNGAEAVVPLEKETAWINRIAQKMNDLQEINPARSNVALNAKMDEMIRTMKNLKSTIVLDTGVLVGETINQIDEGLGNNYSLKERRI